MSGNGVGPNLTGVLNRKIGSIPDYSYGTGLQKAAQASAAGANEIMAKQREALQEGLKEITENVQGFRASAPQELLTKQAELARKSFETAVKQASEVGDILRKSGMESTEILRDRIKTAMDEIKDVYQKKD